VNSEYVEGHYNRGNMLSALRRHEEALGCYTKVIALRPDFAEAYYNQGNALNALKHRAEAVASYEKAMALKPDYEFLWGELLHTKMRICDWHGLEAQVSQLTGKIDRGEKVSTPFPILALTNSAALQLKAAESWTHAKCPTNDVLPMIGKQQRHNKIRIGYFSADFREHALSVLAVELFERHDRSNFEVNAFSFGPDKKDDMRQRLDKAFDKFIDIRNQSDKESAMLARDMEIDIAVDLGGFTQDARTNIFAMRAAPIQVNYLGYPGTMGANYIDYIIADRVLIPETQRYCYAEKIVYLPNSYQANDSKRVIADRQFTRAELGLPQNGFVFCCFNNSYKITPDVFSCWMRILKGVEGSVLWLVEDNASVVSNLRKEATNRGIDPARLVFAKRMPLALHLARHRLADLFLDTLPFNANTTASVSLWAGLPVLTQIGETFAGRAAASLLEAIGLPELITMTAQSYESLAVELAKDPERLASIRHKLADNRLRMPLFDTELFTRHIESAYTTMYERYQGESAPDHIYVS